MDKRLRERLLELERVEWDPLDAQTKRDLDQAWELTRQGASKAEVKRGLELIRRAQERERNRRAKEV
jgi:hypothetical protein